jgi:hypothetical protein
MKKELELRMYGFVPYNISPIQQGIQFGHAKDEWTNKNFYPAGHPQERRYTDWKENWKTYIIYNGGTTNDKKESKWYGSLNQIKDSLNENSIPYSYFCEPDLGDQLTGVTFICDERVFNYDDYPDARDFIINELEETNHKAKSQLFSFDKVLKEEIQNLKRTRNYEDFEAGWGREYGKWVVSLGGKDNVFLRDLIKGRKFA